MQAKLLFPKKASVDEPLDMAAAPSPKNTIATPKFVKNYYKQKLQKRHFGYSRSERS